LLNRQLKDSHRELFNGLIVITKTIPYLRSKTVRNKILVLIFGIILVLSMAACSGGAAASTSDTKIPHQISVTGNGQVYVTPDVAYINIGVKSQADKVADALQKNNDQAAGVANALKAMGVDPKDIQTSAFNVYPQQEFGPNGEVTKTSYVVDNTVYVTVRNLQNLGQMLDAVVQNGANTVNSIQFDVLDKAKATSEARKLAVQDAHAQAQELADAAGVKLGPLTSLNVYSSSAPMPAYQGKGGAPADSGGQVPVSAGQLVVSMDANMVYEILQ
jgi:uncharacterized protein